MSGYPADHYDDGYGHGGHQGHGDSYYQDDNAHGYYDTHDYGDSYYDRPYVPTPRSLLFSMVCGGD